TVLGQLWGVEAIGLSPDVAGVGWINHGRTAPPSQAERHVVLACGLAGMAKFAGDDVDAMLPQSAQDPNPSCAQFAPERPSPKLDLSELPTVGDQEANLEELGVAVDAHAVRIEH